MTSTIIPTLRYRDAAAMIEWLCQAFGFVRYAVHENGTGGIAHAQLTLGTGMIMLSTYEADEFGALQMVPDRDSAVTQSPYIIVEDPDEVFKQARKAGGKIVMEISDWDHGGRGFSCRDPEGHLWNFGSYDPWVKPAQ